MYSLKGKIMDKIQLWNKLSQYSRTTETAMDSLHRKRTGSYYTSLDLTDVMMNELVTNLLTNTKPIESYTFFEPCVGSGNFIFSYLKCISNLNLSQDQLHCLLNNIYVADINKNALETYKASLNEFTETFWNIHLDDEYFSSHIGSGLLVDVSAPELSYISLEEIFGTNIAKQGFDIVVTNPPYKNLKAERSQYGSEEEYLSDQGKYSSISKIVSQKFKYATDGILNLYKLFVEEIIDRYTNSKSYFSLLIPSSIMSDKTCTSLRTHILKDTNLLSAKVIKEGSGFIDAQQALVAILLTKKGTTSTVKVTKDFCNKPNDTAAVNITDILNDLSGNAIIALSEAEYQKYKILRTHPTVSSLSFITNLRGELDLTAGKQYITTEETPYPLLRGRNISYYNLVDSEENDYVSESFVATTKKSQYIAQDRIICQQIANMHKERRVTFAYAKPNFVLGNSCNFISVCDNEYGIDIYTLLGLFNTEIINWFFKLTSSNNHINNYEIDCFPVPVCSKELSQISTLAKAYLEKHDDKLLIEIENLAKRAYGI